MTSRLVLVLGDLFIPDRAIVSLPSSPEHRYLLRIRLTLVTLTGHSRKGTKRPPMAQLHTYIKEEGTYD